MKKRQGAILTTALAAVLAAAALSGCAVSGGAAGNQGAAGSGGTVQAAGQGLSAAAENVISAEGEGVVTVTPDIATLELSITTEGAEAASVRDQNTASYQQVVKFLKGRGIAEGSIATTNVYLNPQYDWSSDVQQLVGYTMETDITVSDIPLSELGSIMDEAVSNGANGIRSVSYKSSQFDETYNEALALAVENARSKAEAMAEASGVTLGSVTGVTEYGANTEARYTQNRMSLTAAPEMAAGDSAMNVMPGELSVKANVSVRFGLQ